MPHRYSDDEIIAMAETYRRGHSARDVADWFDCSTSTVMWAVHALGFRRHSVHKQMMGLWAWTRSVNNGYVVWTQKGHWGEPDQRILEHRLIMGWKLGRELKPNENVHHLNGLRADNRPENLQLWLKSQPSGARITDLVTWARQLIAEYGSLVPED